jgi:hypothetical protein
MLVGDIIQNVRTAITDQAGVLPAPANPSLNAIAFPGSTLPVGIYKGLITFRTPWGETDTNPTEVTFTTTLLAPGITFLTPPLPPGAIALRLYLTLVGGTTGTEQQFFESPVVPFLIGAPGTMGLPPTRNTAYIPDADGDSFSATTIYGWLNDALKIASQICGGLPDVSGVGTVTGQPLYILPDQWRVITDIWYDGYPLAPDKRGNIFRRNPITANVLSSVNTSMLTDRMMLELWPQPARTAASTTLASPMTASDTFAVLTSTVGFLLTNGFVRIGSEICSYAGIAGNTLNNLVRGLSGTTVVAHAAASPVNELNLFFGGWRVYAPNFQPGQASSTIPVPVGWETMLPIYGLARVKLAEQDIQGYNALKGDFEKAMSQWFRTNRVTTGPKQVGETSNTLEVIPTLGGGWVVP